MRIGSIVKFCFLTCGVVIFPQAAAVSQGIIVGPEGVQIGAGGKASTAKAGHRYVNADLDGHSFTKLRMPGATFVNVSAVGADFSGADLSGSSFTNTDVSRADFRNANLRGAKLVNTDWEGADFSGATWVNGKVCGANSIGRCR